MYIHKFKVRKRARKHGFLGRMRTTNGTKTINRRRVKMRQHVAISCKKSCS